MNILALLLIACSGDGAPPVEPVESAPPSVVMITLDTTRADRLGSYGYDKAHTETLDALAGSGRRYAMAQSTTPLTIPAHSAIFTGKYPARLGIRDNGSGVLQDAELTLAEVLSGQGYETAASVAAFVTTRQWGFAQGFDHYFDDIPGGEGNFWHASRSAEQVIDDVLDWKSNGRTKPDAPAFVWVHLYDAHFPYAPDPDHLKEAEGRPYDGELAYVDDQVARLVAAFEGTPTVFIVVGDHGEGLGQHNELTHGLFVFQTTQHVPLFLSGPGIEPAVVDDVVSIVDTMPILLDSLGIEIPGNIDGLPIPKVPARPVYLESWLLQSRFDLAPHLAVVDGNDKLISVPTPELYDLKADLTETAPLDNAVRIAELQADLDAFGFEPPGGDAAHPMDAETLAALEALGYMQGGFDTVDAGPLPDSKEHRILIVKSQRADRLIRLQKRDEAEKVLAELIETYPHIVEFQTRRAQMLAKLGRPDDAEAVLEAAAKADPENLAITMALAGHRAREGKFREASNMY